MTSLTDRTASTGTAVPGIDGAPLEVVGHPVAGIRVAGIHVADYRPGTGLPAEHSPRPYLHPVRSLAGVHLTEVAAGDHPHHYGVSLAVADVDGTSHWGGRTFVAGTGSTMLANHGRQESLALESAPTGQIIEETLLWRDHDGQPQLSESRRIRATLLPDGTGWVLDWTSVLTAPDRAVRIGSPATNGRAGAGYGGIFWRLPNRPNTAVLSAAGPVEAAAHGSSSPWLALNQQADTSRVGLLLTQPTATARPWFVRATEYPGAGPMLAAATVLTIAAGQSITTNLSAVVLDRWVEDAADADDILAAAGLSPGGPPDAAPSHRADRA